MNGASDSDCRNSHTARFATTSERNPTLPDLNITVSAGEACNVSELIILDSGGTFHQNLQVGVSGDFMDELSPNPYARAADWGDVSLRQWLDKPDRSVDVVECLHIFRQIVEIVNVAHSHGIVVQNVRPSCFVMSSFNHVSFIESASCSDSGSESPEDRLKSQTWEVMGSTATLPHFTPRTRSRSEVDHSQLGKASVNASLSSESHCLQPSYANATSMLRSSEGSEHNVNDNKRDVEQAEDRNPPFPMKQVLLMETAWYTSPEEAAGREPSCASDIYRLGVLLFELFCPFSSREEKSITMSSLRHRLLPPQMLLKWSKEASFCLWLLHPEPTSRPQMCELLQTEFLNEAKNNLAEHEAAIELKERIEEQELLLEFLLISQQRKDETSDKLQQMISLLSSDIDEVENLQTSLAEKRSLCPRLIKNNYSASNLPSLSNQGNDSMHMMSRKRFRSYQDLSSAECDDNADVGPAPDQRSQDSQLSQNSLLMKNFKKLEAAYLLTRLRPSKTLEKPLARNSVTSSDGRGSVVVNERSSINNLVPREWYNEDIRKGWVNPFLEGFCKYLSFSKLKVKADLKQGDLLNSSNLICALSFDRDGDFFATAGVNKKIKIFECDSILRDDRDIHYPVVEMAGRSKLSSICWNNYIKSHIASSNFEGVVQLWDFTRSQALMELKEHEKRVWSIDFSSVDPTTLASGSDDGSVKLWNINQANIFFHFVDVSFETKRSKCWDN
uniref:Protein kinase domain-containing protein n=1 Tax=Kalanchoe fedtschenkoi TaxID=63787 RepID=A0A7N0URH1_KALFE